MVYRENQCLGLLDYCDKIKPFANAKASFYFVVHLFREAFHNTLTESIVCRTAVVALNNGAIPEIIMHNKTRFVIDSIDHAENLIHKIEKIKRKNAK